MHEFVPPQADGITRNVYILKAGYDTWDKLYESIANVTHKQKIKIHEGTEMMKQFHDIYQTRNSYHGEIYTIIQDLDTRDGETIQWRLGWQHGAYDGDN